MYNNYVKSINPFIKLLSLLLLVLSIILSKSLPLFVVLLIISFIIVIVSEKNVKLYVKLFKNIIIKLILITIIYIIVIGYDKVYLFLFKMALIINSITIFCRTTDFMQLHYSINKLLIILRIFRIDTQTISYNIALYLYFFKYYIDSKKKIKNNIKFIPKKVLIKIIYAEEKIRQLDISLKLKFYKLCSFKTNVKDIYILIFFVCLFIATIYKEVNI